MKSTLKIDLEEEQDELHTQTLGELLNKYKESLNKPHADRWQYLLDCKKNRENFPKRADLKETVEHIMHMPKQDLYQFIENAVAAKERDRIIIRDLRRHHIEILHDLCRVTHSVPCEHTKALYEMWYDVPHFVYSGAYTPNFFEYEPEEKKD